MISNIFGRRNIVTRPDGSCPITSSNPVTVHAPDGVDASTETNHKSTDDISGSVKSARVDVILTLDNELHEWWGPSLASGDLFVEGLQDETHTHDNKRYRLHVGYNREQVMTFLTPTF